MCWQSHGSSVYALRVLTCVLALALVCSFGLHALQLKHVHPGEHPGHSHHHGPASFTPLGEYLHAAEKKVVASVLSIWTFFLAILVSPLLLRSFFMAFVPAVAVARQRRGHFRERDIYQVLFRVGILNPKLH